MILTASLFGLGDLDGTVSISMLSVIGVDLEQALVVALHSVEQVGLGAIWI